VCVVICASVEISVEKALDGCAQWIEQKHNCGREQNLSQREVMFVWQNTVRGNQDECDRSGRYCDGGKIGCATMDNEPNIHQPMPYYCVPYDAEQKKGKERAIPTVRGCF
jgi:hypothetical protein